MNSIDVLIEKYVGKIGTIEVYVNPTRIDIRNMKEEHGIHNVRFIIHKPTSSLYVWNALGKLHFRVQNMLADKGIISDDYRLEECEYDHPDYICGQGVLGVGKIELSREWSYGNRESELKASYMKYFYKKSLA